MAQFDTRLRRPPVNIGLTCAAQQQQQMLEGVPPLSRAAGGFGAREARFRSVDLALRIDSQGPTRGGALPIGRTRRKRGYPPITLAAQKAGLEDA